MYSESYQSERIILKLQTTSALSLDTRGISVASDENESRIRSALMGGIFLHLHLSSKGNVPAFGKFYS